jgi:hypothetical protein
MNAPIIIAPVRKSVRVKAPMARAFDVFTSGLSRWWPLDHGKPLVGQGHGRFANCAMME